jgi:hypothetical protein
VLAFAKSNPLVPWVNTETLPNVAAVLKVRLTVVAEMVLPMLVDPTFVSVSGLTGPTVKLWVTVAARA